MSEPHDRLGPNARTRLALALGLVLAAGLAAQEEPATLFVERVEVSVVNIEAFVYGPEGQPVVGLTKDDFEVFEDGQRVELTNFFAVAREDRILKGLERGELPAAAMSSPSLRLLPTDQQLSLVVYIDHYNLRPASRRRVLEALEGFLEDRIRQGDNVMLVGGYRGVEVVEPFTRDWQPIVAGLRGMQKASTYRQTDDTMLRQTFISMRMADDPRTAHDFVRRYVQRARSDLRRSASAIRDVVRSLAGLPGRKGFVYVSEGLPQRPGEELYQELLNLFGAPALRAAGPGPTLDPTIEAISEDESALFNEIVREANAHEVTFYTVDATGPGGSALLSAESPAQVSSAAGRTAFDILRQNNFQQPLVEMAAGTGGASLLNTFNFDKVLDELATDFDSFYSLGYRPLQGGDGDFHQIEVRVKDRSLKVRHRSGYVDKRPEEKVADRTISSLLWDLETNPHEMTIDFGRPEKQGRKKVQLPVVVRLPIREITLVRNGKREQGRLQFFVAVKDEEGGISDLHQSTYPVDIPRKLIAEARDKELGYSVVLLVRPGLAKVAVGVWDELSGTESFVHKQVRVESRGDSQKAKISEPSR